MAIRGAKIYELGKPPRPVELDGPVGEGELEVEVAAVALNPIDIGIGSGAFYGGHPPLPFVPGVEGAGRTADGKPVYLFGAGRGLAAPGFMAERVSVPADLPLELPEGTDLAVAAALGVAGLAGWAAVNAKARVGPGDRVLVLGATGTVGLIAVQAAKLAGADLVVASGRSASGLEQAARLGADETVSLNDSDALAAVFGDDGFTVCIDPIWGEPLADALGYAAHAARIVNLGSSAGADTSLPSALIRSRELLIQGHTNFSLSPREREEMYLALLGAVTGREVEVPLERHSLDDVEAAWVSQREGARAKLVVEL